MTKAPVHNASQTTLIDSTANMAWPLDTSCVPVSEDVLCSLQWQLAGVQVDTPLHATGVERSV